MDSWALSFHICIYSFEEVVWNDAHESCLFHSCQLLWMLKILHNIAEYKLIRSSVQRNVNRRGFGRKTETGSGYAFHGKMG